MRIFFTVAFLLSLSFAKAQNDVLPDTKLPALKQSFAGMENSFRNLNLDSLLEYTHPNIFKNTNMESIKLVFDEFLANFKKEDIHAVKIEGPLQLVKIGDEYQGVFSQYIDITVMGQNLKSTTYLIGESFEKATKWKFMDYKMNKQLAESVIPNLSPLLKLPVELNGD